MGRVMILLSGETETAGAMNNEEEYVYLLTNPCMPEYVKVGRTNDIERRLKDLSKPTAIAEPFECYSYLTVRGDKPNADQIEKALHFFLSREFKQSKEYFIASVSEVEKYFKHIETINPRIKYSLYNIDKKKKRSSQTTFKMLKIEPNTVLVYKQNSSISCIVQDEKNKVLYNGQTTTLSNIASTDFGRPVNGFEYFMISGESETLWERRKRLEK